VAPCAVQRHAKREKNDFLSLSASNNKTVPSPLQDDAHMKLESGVWKADVRIQVPGRCTIHSVAKTKTDHDTKLSQRLVCHLRSTSALLNSTLSASLGVRFVIKPGKAASLSDKLRCI
jgi:hypothetical protein